MTDDSSKRVTREDLHRITKLYRSSAELDAIFDALPATPAASETADAAWWHEQINGDPLLPDCSGTHLMGYGTCQRLAALSRSTPTPDATDAVPQPTPDEERDAVLAERLDWEAEQEATPDATDGSREALREAAQAALTGLDELGETGETVAEFIGMEDAADALRAALAAPTPTPDATDGGSREAAVESALLYTFQLSDKDYRKMQMAMSEVAFIRALEQDGYTVSALAAPSTPTTEGLDVLRDWADVFYGPIEEYDGGERGMTQLDHGHDEYEARMDVVALIRAAASSTSADVG